MIIPVATRLKNARLYTGRNTGVEGSYPVSGNAIYLFVAVFRVVAEDLLWAGPQPGGKEFDLYFHDEFLSNLVIRT